MKLKDHFSSLIPFPRLLRISYYKAPSVRQVQPYILPKNMEVVELVTGGVVRFQVDGKEARLGCGALFWHEAGEKTIHLTDAEDPYECLAVAFAVQTGAVRQAPRLSIIGDHQRARDLCTELLGAYQDKTVDQEMLKVYACSRLSWEAHLATTRKTSLHQHPAVESARAFAEAHFKRPNVGVREMAGAAGVSAPHLHALFRENIGQTPYQFLAARRIREAKERLSGSRDSIKGIAVDCGFQNIETFYRAFKKTVGLSPNRFRLRRNLPILARL